MSDYTGLKIEKMITGNNTTTWGDVTNTNWDALESAIVGSATVSFSNGNATVSPLTNDNGPQPGRNIRLVCTGTTGGTTRDLTIPSTTKTYIIQNDCIDGSIRVKGTGPYTITVPAGKTMWVYVAQDGADYNVVDAVTYLTTLSLGTPLATTEGGTGSNTVTYCNLQANVKGILPTANGGTGSNLTTYCNLQTNVSDILPVANGGTGGNTAANARTGLGATVIGGNMFTLTNPSAVTFPRFNADNTVTALNAADFRTAIGAGSGSGTVTQVNGTGSVNGLTLSGSVNTSGNVTLSGDITSVNANATINGVVIGYRSIPRSTSSTAATTDVGKCISTTANVTIPNGTFSAGDAVSIYNNSNSSVNIVQASGLTMYLSGTTTTGTRTLAARGLATVWFDSASGAVISGGGLS